jgi:hypothetical protein
MKTLVSFLSGLALGAAALGLMYFGVQLELVVTLAAGAACLGWLGLVVVLPWNVHFQARHALLEAERSRRAGIAVDAEREREARQVAARMRWVAIGLHLGSAALLAFGAWLYARPLGYVFAGLFLFTTFFRPALEYYRALRRRLGDFLEETKYPRADVVTLVADVRRLESEVAAHEKSLEASAERLTQVDAAGQARDAEHRRKLDAVARRFEETLDRLTDNQEIISGIKAFLRLVQAPATEGP